MAMMTANIVVWTVCRKIIGLCLGLLVQVQISSPWKSRPTLCDLYRKAKFFPFFSCLNPKILLSLSSRKGQLALKDLSFSL